MGRCAMWNGKVESIHIASTAIGAIQALDHAVLIPGVGLEGDRYALRQGTFFKPEPDFELTLIEAEAIEALQREYAVELVAGDVRRNIVTRDVPLNHLVGREFLVGEVRARGLRLCEPCSHLQKLSHQKVLPGLVHRGGLRAQILSEGTIQVCDSVKPYGSYLRASKF